MSLKKSFSYSIVVLSLFVFAGTAAAQGTATAPRVTMEAEVVQTLSLEISSHGSGVVGTGLVNEFVVDLGNLNGLGLGTPLTGVSKSVSGSGAASVAKYTTPISLTPIFSGYGAGTASITLSLGGGTNDAIALEGNSHAAAALAAAGVVVASSATNTANTRYVGFNVSQTQAAGSLSAMFVYTVSVQ